MVCKGGFILIDLVSQRDAVKKYVERWKPHQVLEWLSQFGKVTYSRNIKQQSYYFQSTVGCTAAFYFSDQGNLVVIKSPWVDL